MSESKGAVAAVRGVELAYDIGGASDGLPFIWGHGLTGNRSEEDNFPLVDFGALRNDRRVVRYDALGHGESSALPQAERGAWAELALDMVGLIDHLDLGRVVVGGASMGAGTALHAALALGDRLAGMVLVIPPTAWNARADQTEMYGQLAAIIDERGVEPLVAAPPLPPPEPFADDAEWHRRRAAGLRRADPTRLAANFRGAAFADLPSFDELRTLAVPTLVLAWNGDPGHPVSTAERLAEALPHVEVRVAVSRHDFDSWTERVRQFLASLPDS